LASEPGEPLFREKAEADLARITGATRDGREISKLGRDGVQREGGGGNKTRNSSRQKTVVKKVEGPINIYPGHLRRGQPPSLWKAPVRKKKQPEAQKKVRERQGGRRSMKKKGEGIGRFPNPTQLGQREKTSQSEAITNKSSSVREEEQVKTRVVRERKGGMQARRAQKDTRSESERR